MFRPLLSLTGLAHAFDFYVNCQMTCTKEKAQRPILGTHSSASENKKNSFLLPTHCGTQEERKEVNFHKLNRRDSSPKPV